MEQSLPEDISDRNSSKVIFYEKKSISCNLLLFYVNDFTMNQLS